MMKRRILISVTSIFLSLMLAQCQAIAQGTQAKNAAAWTLDEVQARIAEQVVLLPQEKIHLHTDRSQYVIGEQIWFRAHVVDAVLHTPVHRQDYVFVELINAADSIIHRLRIKEFEETFSGMLSLPLSLHEGDYVLRAYTDNLRNLGPEYFFHKKIKIYAPMSGSSSGSGTGAETDQLQLGVDFFPEGGYMIEGVPNRIAFKAIWQDGSPATLEGQLVDSDGIAYGPAQTLHEGMGLIPLTPLPGKTYSLIVDGTPEYRGEQRFVLPAGTRETYGLRTEMVDGELQVSVLNGSGWLDVPPLYVLLHTRGMVQYWLPWDMDYTSMAFDVADFPSGVTQVLLLDGEGRSLAERLVFFNQEEASAIGEVETEKSGYGPKELVHVAVKLKDADGMPLKGNFSVSILDDHVAVSRSEVNVQSTLLLDSELKGYVADPAFYLERGQEAELDLLMMIHGWRRYAIPEVLAQQYTRPTVPKRTGMEIRGRVEWASGRPAAGSKVSLLSWDTGFAEEVETGEDGRFVFTGFEAPDSLSFVVQAEPARGRNNLVLHIEGEDFAPMRPLPGMFPLGQRSGDGPGAGLGISQEESLVRSTLMNRQALITGGDAHLRQIEIDEVSVEARRVPAVQENFSFYMPNDRRNVLTAEQLEEIQPQNISEALRHIPFLTIQADTNDQLKVYIGQMRNNSMMAAATGPGQPAVVVIDDMIIDDYDLDMLMDPSNIEKIGVLKGTAAMMLGGQGSGGAIVISTKKGMSRSALNQPASEYLKLVTPLGYQPPVEFYSPRYETDEERNHTVMDERFTIYWNPKVLLNEQGEASFEFYTSQQAPSNNFFYEFVIEGVAEDGTIIHLVEKIR